MKLVPCGAERSSCYSLPVYRYYYSPSLLTTFCATINFFCNSLAVCTSFLSTAAITSWTRLRYRLWGPPMYDLKPRNALAANGWKSTKLSCAKTRLLNIESKKSPKNENEPCNKTYFYHGHLFVLVVEFCSIWTWLDSMLIETKTHRPSHRLMLIY